MIIMVINDATTFAGFSESGLLMCLFRRNIVANILFGILLIVRNREFLSPTPFKELGPSSAHHLLFGVTE